MEQKTAYEIGVRLVGSEMCIRDSQKSDVTPLERSWATEVLDLCAALGEERGGWGP